MKGKQRSSSEASAVSSIEETPVAMAATDGVQGEPPTEGEVSPPIQREQLVREAAYRRFEARGWVHGHDEEDWRAAEQEVRPPLGN